MDRSLAPQVGLEPTTLRLTAERLIVASRCKRKYLDARKRDFPGNWGDFGGTREFPIEQPVWVGPTLGGATPFGDRRLRLSV
jgi:hypothetical protein